MARCPVIVAWCRHPAIVSKAAQSQIHVLFMYMPMHPTCYSSDPVIPDNVESLACSTILPVIGVLHIYLWTMPLSWPSDACAALWCQWRFHSRVKEGRRRRLSRCSRMVAGTAANNGHCLTTHAQGMIMPMEADGRDGQVPSLVTPRPNGRIRWLAEDEYEKAGKSPLCRRVIRSGNLHMAGISTL